jgi:hypothetical protein
VALPSVGLDNPTCWGLEAHVWGDEGKAAELSGGFAVSELHYSAADLTGVNHILTVDCRCRRSFVNFFSDRNASPPIAPPSGAGAAIF